jgi:hypothetical protein
MTDQTQTETETVNAYSKEFVDKVLTEKKNAMQSLTELKQKVMTYEAQLKETEEARLKEKEDWKSYAELKVKEAQEANTKFQALETKLQTQVKIGAIKKEFEKLGIKDNKLVEGIVPLLKLDMIKYDENTQTVIGAEDEVKRIKESLPQIFMVQSAAKVNHDASNNAPQTYSVEKFKEMARKGAPIKEIREYEKGLLAQLAKK